VKDKVIRQALSNRVNHGFSFFGMILRHKKQKAAVGECLAQTSTKRTAVLVFIPIRHIDHRDIDAAQISVQNRLFRIQYQDGFEIQFGPIFNGGGKALGKYSVCCNKADSFHVRILSTNKGRVT
jgi:hypothetical protein